MLCAAGMIGGLPSRGGGGCESVVDLRKGPQGALPWEAGGRRGEKSPEAGLLSFPRSPHAGLSVQHGGRRRLKAPQCAGSWVLVSLCGVVGVIGPIRAAPGVPLLIVVSRKT